MMWWDLICLALVLIGAAFFGAGTIGILRFSDSNSRIHALAKADNAGLGFVLLGLALHSGSFPIAAKLVLIWALALLASATASHLLAEAPHDSATTRPAGGNR